MAGGHVALGLEFDLVERPGAVPAFEAVHDRPALDGDRTGGRPHGRVAAEELDRERGLELYFVASARSGRLDWRISSCNCGVVRVWL